MDKTRAAVKWVAGALAATALVIVTTSAPATAAKPDHGSVSGGTTTSRYDTGWG